MSNRKPVNPYSAAARRVVDLVIAHIETVMGGTVIDAPHAARESESGLRMEPVHGPDALAGWEPTDKPGEPGTSLFTRGAHPSTHTGRPWTMRQYAGLGTAVGSDARYKQLIANGTTGLPAAFDLPTRMGHHSAAPTRRACRPAQLAPDRGPVKDV